MSVTDEIRASDFVLASDGATVLFSLFVNGREVSCSITRNALEQHFWLPAAAVDARVLKAFADGRPRIVALAWRQALRLRTESLTLTAHDFEHKSSPALSL